MIGLLLTSLVLIVISYQMGALTTNALKYTYFDFTLISILGLIVINSILGVISLFYPINDIVLYAFIIFVIFYSLLNKFNWGYKLYKEKSSIILFCFISFLGLLKASNYIDNYDSGLYHIQTIKWIGTYKIIPGLANLHGRFGFNSNVFLIDSLIEFRGFIEGISFFPINISLFFLVSYYLISNIFFLVKKRGNVGVILFTVIIQIVVFRLDNFSSPSPDFIVVILLFYIFSRNVIEDYKSFSDQNLVPTIVISFYLLTVKLSVLPVFVFVMLLFCLKYKSIKIAQLRILFISSVVIILPWLIRNIIISGWLVYPMASVDFFNFDWKVPISLVVSESNSIVGWARNPGADYLHSLELNAFSWMSIWWENQVLSIKIILVCCLVFSFFNLIYALFKKNSILSMPNILLITSFLGIVFWLFTAPDFRFGFPFIVLNFWIIVLNIKSDLKYKYSRFIVLIILIVLPLYSVKRETLEFLNSGGNSIIIPKGFKEQSSLKFDIRQIKGGSIFIPTKSDQCFNCALPCTPYYNKDLEFRVSDNPIFGFRHK